MATYTVDKIAYGGNTYNLQDAGALQLTGGSVTGPVTFGDSVSVDDLSVGTLSTTGNATFANNIQANKINNVTVGSSPKFTDTVTTVSTTGSGNAITSITASNGAITATKGSTFLTSSDVSGKIDTAGTGLSKSGTTLNHSNSVTAQSTQAVYPIKIDAQGHISAYGSAVTIPSITLNGSSTTSPSFYAPTGAGTSGQYLKSSGTGAPAWTNFPTIPSITLNGSSTTSPSFYAPTSAGTSGYYLKSSGSGAPTWTAFPTIPTVPSAGSSASAVGTSASGGSATTWSRSDHVHNITSATITSALGFTPASSDTKVTQNVIASDDANSYPVLLSASTDGTTATTETALKCSSFTFIRDDSGANSLTLGAGRVILGRVNYNSNETTRSSGTGIGIGTGDTSDSEMYYRTAGSGQFVMQHWTAAKKSDTTPADGSYRDSIITMSTAANNPTLYLYNKSSADTITSYSRLNASQLYINDGTAHAFSAADIDKVHYIGTITSNKFTKSVSSGTSLVSLGTFSIPVGSYIVFVTVYFPSMGTGKRVCMDVSGTGVPLNTADVRASSGTTNYLKCQFAITCSAATTITVKGYQNSGSSLSLTVNYQYIRVA